MSLNKPTASRERDTLGSTNQLLLVNLTINLTGITNMSTIQVRTVSLLQDLKCSQSVRSSLSTMTSEMPQPWVDALTARGQLQLTQEQEPLGPRSLSSLTLQEESFISIHTVTSLMISMDLSLMPVLIHTPPPTSHILREFQAVKSRIPLSTGSYARAPLH